MAIRPGSLLPDYWESPSNPFRSKSAWNGIHTDRFHANIVSNLLDDDYVSLFSDGYINMPISVFNFFFSFPIFKCCHMQRILAPTKSAVASHRVILPWGYTMIQENGPRCVIYFPALFLIILSDSISPGKTAFNLIVKQRKVAY
jgi:hypothetical protein